MSLRRALLGTEQGGSVLTPAERPRLLEPLIEVVFRNHAQRPLLPCGLPITSRLPLHKDELNIVLYHGVRLVWLPRKLPPPSTSKLALAILCQMIGFRLSNPSLRHLTEISE